MITAIEEQADGWRDIDSVLATSVRSLVRSYRAGAPLSPPPTTPPGKTLR